MVGLYLWRHSLPYDLKLAGWDLSFSITLLARGFLTLSLLLAPVLALTSPTRLWRSLGQKRWIALVGSIALAIAIALIARLEFLGNVIHPFGATWLMAGGGVRTWPLWFNRALLMAGVLAGAVLILLIVALVRRALIRGLSLSTVDAATQEHAGRVLLVTYPLVLIAAHVVATAALGAWLIDRYFLLLLPFLGGALLVTARSAGLLVVGRWQAWSAGVLAGSAVVGAQVTVFDAAVEGGRWQLANGVAQSGIPRGNIDGGMQWFSFHEAAPGLPAQEVPTRTGRQWWTERYPDRLVCVTIRTGADPSELVSRTIRLPLGPEILMTVVPGPDPCDTVGTL